MAFRFRLEKVLNFRKNIVDKHSREVSDAAREVTRIQTNLDCVHQEMSALLKEDYSSASGIDIQTLRQRRLWLDHLEGKLDQLIEFRAAANSELESRRAKLTEVWRDLEVLQKLKERQKTVWIEEQFKRENLEMDEIGQIIADRKKREKLAFN